MHIYKAMRQVFVAAGVGLLVGGTEALAQEVVRVRVTIERIEMTVSRVCRVTRLAVRPRRDMRPIDGSHS